MSRKCNTLYSYLGFTIAIFLVLTPKSAFADDGAKGLPLITPMPEPPAEEVDKELAPEIQPEAPTETPQQSPSQTTPAPAAPEQNQTVIYAVPVKPTQAEPSQPANPWMDLRKLPKKLHPIEGQEPPFGYVEIEKRKRGLVIAGSSLFGATYLVCLAFSTANRKLAIPVLGPAIAGYTADVNDNFWGGSADDARFSAGLFGTLGTLAQAAGVTMFVLGMVSKKKIWLRQDIAGVSFQFAPTLVGRKDPGIGVVGRF